MISSEALEKARSLVANYGSDPDGLLVGAIAAEIASLKKQVEELTAERDEEAKCVDYAEKDFLKAIARAESAEAEAAALRKERDAMHRAAIDVFDETSMFPITEAQAKLSVAAAMNRAALEAASRMLFAQQGEIIGERNDKNR